VNHSSKFMSQLVDDSMNDESSRDVLDRSILAAIETNDLLFAKELLDSLHIADLADLIEKAHSDDIINKIIDIIKPINPMLLVEIQTISIKEDIIDYLGFELSAKIISELEIDDSFSILIDLDEKITNIIIDNMDDDKKQAIHELFSYPENSAGRIMQKKFVAVAENFTVSQAIKYIQNNASLPKDLYEVFIIDSKHRPTGYVSLGALLSSKSSQTLKEIQKTEMKIINTNLDQEEMSYQFKQYGLISAPVVNKIGRLVGVVTIEDAVLVMEKEAEEDLMFIGGIREADFHLQIIEIVKSRFPWLCMNLFTASLAAFVINQFVDTIEKTVILAAIMPIVASLGGNAGTQTMTVSLLGLSSKDITAINSLRIIIKQAIACLINGVLIAFIGGIILYFWRHEVYLSVVFAISTVINFVFAGFFGSAIPILIKRLGIDPAVASPIFLTTLTDILGFVTFLGFASYLF
jgi:magnesium transporter